MLQNMMNNYIDQSKNLFVQMQDQMQGSDACDVLDLPVHARGHTRRNARSRTQIDPQGRAEGPVSCLKTGVAQAAPVFFSV